MEKKIITHHMRFNTIDPNPRSSFCHICHVSTSHTDLAFRQKGFCYRAEALQYHLPPLPLVPFILSVENSPLLKAMELPVIDLSPYLEIAGKSKGDSAGLSDQDPEYRRLCSEVSRCLRETGALLVKDPRCSAEDNDRFIDMMEKYFERPEQFKRLQERRHLHYQVCKFSTS